MKQLIKKQKSHAFRKDVYLLGKDENGIKYWLESPTWDCGWYWGFGYVETYENNRQPDKARDIDSHQHVDSSFMRDIDGKYIHNIYECPTLKQTTFTEHEGWILSELFKTFYILKESAELFGRGDSNITSNPLKEKLTDISILDKINKELIPAVTSEIIKILSPKC